MKTFSKLILISAIFCAGAFLNAQQFTGHVTDSTGAVLPRATVLAHNLATGVETRTTTTSSGDYTIPYLIPGNYTVSAQAPGF
ncbi:MAG TPA: carboxypeptidase-like regulatory domain-containing protein, partial [Terracidiphilus sp.]|nr:carboxypeptidase-like regulatory domain-containing protein [Terracidiphilus sp.]